MKLSSNNVSPFRRVIDWIGNCRQGKAYFCALLLVACAFCLASTSQLQAQSDVLAINSGGAATGTFSADADYSGGGTYTTTSAITTTGVANAAPAAVYQSERSGAITYTLPGLTAGASYTVRLHFAEIYFTKAGQRVFNVAINGTPVLTNFDVFATAGAADKAVVEQFPATANASGQITVSMTNGTADQPKISGIEIVNSSAPPAAPTGLSATAVSSSQINLSWTASTTTGVTYSIYRSTTSGFTPASSNQIAASQTGTTYVDMGLGASTTYYYVAEANNSVGNSVASNQATATTQAPSTGGTDVLAINAGGAATGSFSADEDFTGGGTYTVTNTINVSAANAAPAAVYQSERQGTATYTLPGLTSGNSYTVRLHFAELYFTAAGDRAFDVAINGTPVLTNFDIYATAGAAYKAVVETFTATANSSGDIVVALTNGSANQPLVNGIEVQGSVSAPPVPNAPTGLTATATSSSQINLSWTASTTTGVTYSVYSSTTSGFTPGSSNQIAAGLTTTSYANTGLTASTAYYYVVEAINSTGSSAPTSQANATTQPGTTNGTDVFAINSGGPVVGTYTADEDAIGGGTAVTTNVISTTGVTSPAPAAVYQSERSGIMTYTLPGLTAGSTYTVRLHFAEFYWTKVGQRIFNVTINGTAALTNFDIIAAAGAANQAVVKQFTTTANSSGQIVISFTAGSADQPKISGIEVQGSGSTPPPTVPNPPTGLNATTVSSSQINLGWTASTTSGATYVVFRSTTAGFTPASSNQIATTPGATYSDTGLSASTTYYYAVEASNSAGNSAPTSEASATTLTLVNSTGYVSINAGGAAVSNSSGGDNSFVADADFNGAGTTYSVPNSITIPASESAIAAPAAVYQSARQGALTYTLPGLTAGGSYIVRLHFAELYFSAAGGRVFNVAINGTTVLANFDVFATAGAADTAVVKQYTEVANSSGNIVISLTNGSADQPSINGIEVLDATPCTTLPSAPTGLTATAAYPSVIGLSWTATQAPANCSISSYNLYGGTTANPTTLIASGLNGTTYTNTGLTGSTTYYYTVKAVDAYGSSAASAQASTTTPTPVVIAPPTSLTAVGSSYQQIDLRWVPSTAPAPNTAPVNYSIYRSTTTPFTPSASNLMGTTVGITNYVDNNYPATLTAGESSIPPGPGVQPSTTYYYMVVATTLSGASPAATASATSLPATPSTAAPGALTGMTAMAENANEIDLIWNSTNSGVGTVATTYYIYRSTTTPFTPATSNLIGTTKSNWFQDALCTASTQYYYQVLANSSLGVSPSSTTVTSTTPALNPNLWGGAPFWDASNIPAKPAGDTLMVKFLNRTNGKYTDAQITYSATINGSTVNTSIAANPTYAMGANSSGRMYFFLNDPTADEDNTDYWDYIEFTVGASFINMDTTRVDALGVKIAFNLSCSDGTNVALGENEQVFTEDRSVTFQRYLSAAAYSLTGAAPYDFRADETAYAPYRIIEPGGAGFNTGGPYQNYYANYISSIWSFNGITIPLATSNGQGLGDNPDLSAAIFRQTAPISGTPEFNAAGDLTNEGMWGNPASFYQKEPYDHYAQWIEAQAINMQQYAFPYNDAGGYSSDIGCSNPNTLIVAIGW